MHHAIMIKVSLGPDGFHDRKHSEGFDPSQHLYFNQPVFELISDVWRRHNGGLRNKIDLLNSTPHFTFLGLGECRNRCIALASANFNIFYGLKSIFKIVKR